MTIASSITPLKTSLRGRGARLISEVLSTKLLNVITNGVVAEASGKRSPERRAVRRMGRALACQLGNFCPSSGGELELRGIPGPGCSPIAASERARDPAGRRREERAGRAEEGRGGEGRSAGGRLV